MTSVVLLRSIASDSATFPVRGTGAQREAQHVDEGPMSAAPRAATGGARHAQARRTDGVRHGGTMLGEESTP